MIYKESIIAFRNFYSVVIALYQDIIFDFRDSNIANPGEAKNSIL